MGKVNLEGQMDLFSIISNAEDINADDEFPLIITDADNINENNEVPAEPKIKSDTELDLEEGDVIWAVIDKKVESHIVITAEKDFCITQSENGQKRRLTIRSKGICWEHTREKAQELCDKPYPTI